MGVTGSLGWDLGPKPKETTSHLSALIESRLTFLPPCLPFHNGLYLFVSQSKPFLL